ncbi:uncharacterized protein LOC133183276 [Saccostrea echinata]|uniref:uncharacterized protein LOC133183276 n=1 Tax=Saccostrea echinata TaxID=191078 RepID=UPI002A7F0BF6|nr:uncharacterized protein LOC133183276 [Saccostrea echinata]
MHCQTTIKCLVFLVFLPGIFAFFWEKEYKQRPERQTYTILQDLLKESRSRHLYPEQAQYITTVKRGDRYSINDLIAYLKGMVGSDEIYHTGKSTYVRWGAGG